MAAADLLKNAINNIKQQLDTYPETKKMLSIEKANSYITQSVIIFLQSMFTGNNKDKKVASIGQALMQKATLQALTAPP